MLGDLNVDLKRERWTNNDSQSEKVALIASLALEDLNQHFVQRKGIGDWTWSQRRENRRIFRRCDYILATDPHDFQTFRIKTPRFDSDHRMLVGILRTESKRQHQRYVRTRTRFSNQIRTEDKSRADHLMEELAELIEGTPSIDSRKASWISDESWKLINAKAEARRCGNAQVARSLKRLLRKSLQADRKSRIDKVANEVDSLLKDAKVQEAYGILRSWYRDKPGHVAKPTIQDEQKTRKEYESLFTAEEPPGMPIPIHITPNIIDDSRPTEKEICTALKGMRLGKTPGGSGIRVEHLRKWMEGAKPGEFQDQACVTAWEKVLELVELTFTGQPLPRSFGIGILVLIPKDVPDQYRGIALLEVIYKLVAAIINRRLRDRINFHEAVHGFRRARGTGTAIIGAKLIMQLAQRTTRPRYFVFLDLKKAYDTLDRDRALEILKGYGIGENIQSIIKRVWDMDTMVPKQGGFYGEPFSAGRGVRQGDILSPMIFNIIVDAVIRDVEFQLGLGREIQRRAVDEFFYADDGVLTGEEATEVQQQLDCYTETFARVGLKMNAAKTKAMIMDGGKIFEAISTHAYTRRITGVGETYRERSLQKVVCELCGQETNLQHLKKHQMTRKCNQGQEAQRATTQPNPVADMLLNEHQPEVMESPASEYLVSMDGITETPCPVANCPAHPKQAAKMRLHFRSRHNKDTIIIEEEGRLPRCGNCGLFQMSVGPRHQQSLDCQRWTKTRLDRDSCKVNKKAVLETVFSVQGTPIETVTEFKYLGRVVEKNDDDWPTVNRNIKRARISWGRICRILSREGANPKAMASIYKAVVQAVLLYGSESWVLTQAMEKKLQAFHHRCARHITGQHIRQNPDETWTCPSSIEVLKMAGLWTIQEYIQRRRKTVMEYARTKYIFRKCAASSPLASNPNQLVWWNPD